MSDNRPLPPPPLEPGTFRAADGSIRRFTTSRFLPNDRLAVPVSARLATVIHQLQDDLDRITRHYVHPAPAPAPDPGPDPRSMASGSDRDRQRFNRDPQPPNDSLPPLAAPHLPPLRSLGSRARPPLATFSGSVSRSSRYRPTDRHADRYRPSLAPTSTLDDLSRNLHENDAQLRALLDFTNSTTTTPAMPRPPPSLSPPLHGHDMAEENRRVKRRKLESDRVASTFKGFQYGMYGQVEPGQLAMEIVSCDGGLYSDESLYLPENILRNDASVYCTKSSWCNIVLKHQGGTVFTLQELVIKAPGSKFSCPVREGMVFLAMESNDLFARTARYQIQYLPSRSHRRGTVIFRHEEDGTSVTRVQPRPLRAYSHGADDDDDDDDDNEDDRDSRTAQIPPEFTASAPLVNVTIECSEDESDEDHDGHPRPPRRRTPNRIGALPFESDSDDGESSIQIFSGTYRHWPTEEELARDAALAASGGARRRAPRAGNRRGMTLEEAHEMSQIATQEAVRAVGGELMPPTAHFFIEKDKNKCTVRFDPPVSGRFMLLKMWSPHQDPGKNIDIKAVVAKGFAGPRFCPAVDLA